MRRDTRPTGDSPDDTDDEQIEVPLEEVSKQEADEEEAGPDELSFCELCGASEDDDDELLRCEECGRLHCSNCREYDNEGTPYCSDCYDEIAGK